METLIRPTQPGYAKKCLTLKKPQAKVEHLGI